VAASTVRTLVTAIPEDRLRDLCVQIILDRLTPPPAANSAAARQDKLRENVDIRAVSNPPTEPAECRREQNRKYAAARRAKRLQAAAKPAAPAVAAITGRRRRGRKPSNSAGNGQAAAPITPLAFWQHAEKLEPQAPWRAVVREFEVKETIAQQAYRSQSLPPRVGPMAVSFLTLPAG
jgi:hypothetical protein